MRETSQAAAPETASMRRIIRSACSFCLGEEVIKSHSEKFRFIIKKSLSSVRRVKHCHQFFQGLLWNSLLESSRSRNISPDPFAEDPRAFLGSGGGRGDSFGFVPHCFLYLCHAGLVWGFLEVFMHQLQFQRSQYL